MVYVIVIVLTLYFLLQVDPSKVNVVQTNCRSYSNSCRTFNDYGNDADTYFTSDSYFSFIKGIHHLNVTVFIRNVVNLSFAGDESDIILCNGCSIIWTNSSKLFWTSLNLIFNHTNETANNSAIRFEKSEDVTLLNASFSKFYCDLNFFSRAILVVGSSVKFENCKFENGYHSTGGSLYIEDSNAMFGGHNAFLNNTAYSAAGAMYGLRSQIQVSGNNTFLGNRVGIEEYGLNCGGTAIHVEFSSVSLNGYFQFHNNQNIRICLSIGGGTISASSLSSITMQGIFYFSINSNTNGGAISLLNSECLIKGYVEFQGNEAFCNGGAISLHNSECYIGGHVEFRGNKALSDGGAISLHNSECYIGGHVEFEGNVALNGGAISATHDSSINSNDFYLRYNSEYINHETSSTSNLQSIIFHNNSAQDSGGAVDLCESNMTLTGFVMFTVNKARLGGAVSIYYNSRNYPNFIIFQEPLDMLFNSNIARELGGALYINDADSGCRQQESCYFFYCFFTVNGSMRFVNIKFLGNKASYGTGIYGGAIQYCKLEVRNKIQRGYKVLQNMTKSTAIQNEYANRNPYKIRLCNGTTSVIRVQRGQVFNFSVTVLGEFDIPVYQSIAFTIDHYDDPKTSSEVFSQPYNYLIEKGCRNLGFNILSRRQAELITLYLPQCSYKPSSLVMNIHLDDCPPGFEVIINSCKCQETICKVTGLKDLCNSRTGLIKCPKHDWMKPILDENLTYQGFMWSPNCPDHLCNNNEDNWLDFSSDNVDFQCLENRTAMLCGACLQNYSLTLSSLKCSKCDSNNYLSLLLVFALAGVVLIASLLLLRMTVADGTINGLILYANIINIIKDIILSQNTFPPNPLTIFLSWLILDFGIPTCFYTGLNYYSYTWLQFVFPFYLWFLVGLIILACKYSSRAMKLFGSNPVAVLATVVLMSYSKLLHTSEQILSYVTVYYSNGTQEKRWKIDPTLLYFQGKHIPLALFGIFIVLTFLVPYILLISFGHYLQKRTNQRGLRWLIKIKPILDAYYAPFHDSTRYWVGLMLFIRTCLSITYSALTNTEHNTILVIVSSVLTGVALIPWLQHKIYEKNFVNVLEGSFILNVIVLSILSYHNITREYKKCQLVLSYTCIGIAFFEFLAILAFHVWHRMNLKRLYMKHCKSYRSASAESSNQCAAKAKEDKPGGSAPTTMVFDIREPLLDTSTDL